jgi:hypothetical protein
MKEIPLSQGKTALVDDEDFEYLNQWKWCAVSSKTRNTFYALRTINVSSVNDKCRQIRMHREIMKTSKGLEVDHIDGDGLNNQKYNLRNCSRLQNVLNQKIQKVSKTSRYRGVLWNGRRKWRVQIQYKGKVHYLGYFNIEEEAARAWDRKALELFGEFARLNFPKEGLQ